MPDYNGVLTEDERRKVDVWYRENWRIRRCPVCNQSQWVLADHVVMPILHTPLGTSTGGPGYPQFMIICQSCGLTLYFNAITAGILEGT